MPSNNTLNQTPDAPSQEGAPENECNHPCGCTQATYLIVEPTTGEISEYEYVAPLGYRGVQRTLMWEDIVLDTLSAVETWAENFYNKAKIKQENRRNKNHTDK